MPWSLKQRDGKWCVIKDSDGSSAGCHDSRTDAIKQQRALYAQESRMASIYDELDAMTEEYVEPAPEVKAQNSELVRIEIGKEHDALIASLSDRMEAMTQQQAETQMALVAALHAIGTRNPVVNVEAPNVSVEPPSITVEQPEITVHPPEVTVQAAQAPNVTVNPEIVVPEKKESKRTVAFLRDFSGRIEGAEIAEE